MQIVTLNLSFSENDWGQFLLSAAGLDSIPVEPVRCFPLTHPDEHISLLDEHGHEVVRVASLNDLPPEARRLLEQELAEREFSPVIERIIRAGTSPPCSWDVETDRGPTRFEITSEDDLRRLPDRSVLIVDTNGIRYRIPQPEQLDAVSRAILRRFL